MAYVLTYQWSTVHKVSYIKEKFNLGILTAGIFLFMVCLAWGFRCHDVYITLHLRTCLRNYIRFGKMVSIRIPQESNFSGFR